MQNLLNILKSHTDAHYKLAEECNSCPFCMKYDEISQQFIDSNESCDCDIKLNNSYNELNRIRKEIFNRWLLLEDTIYITGTQLSQLTTTDVTFIQLRDKNIDVLRKYNNGTKISSSELVLLILYFQYQLQRAIASNLDEIKIAAAKHLSHITKEMFKSLPENPQLKQSINSILTKAMNDPLNADTYFYNLSLFI